MFPYSRAILVGLVMAALAALPGCGSGSNPAEAPAASISPAAQATAAKPARPARPPVNLHPKVAFQTTAGEFVLELDAEKAPQTVQNFLLYLDEGHYDRTLLHQVVKGCVIVGGTYDENLVERKNHPPIMNEAHNGLKNVRGTIAMARRANLVDSATSQFFINLADNGYLDHKQRTVEDYGYCVFGKVVSGLEVLDRIALVEVRDAGEFASSPVEKIVVNSVRRVP